MYAAEYPIIPADAKIPYQLAGIGKCGNQCRISRHNGFNLYMIFYTRSGSGKITYNQSEYILNKGDVIILSKDIPYEYEPLTESWHTNWITFIGEYINETISALNLDFGKLIHYESLEAVNDIFRRMMGIIRSHSHDWTYTCSALLYSLFTELAVHTLSSSWQNEISSDSFINPAIDYINKNFSKDITLEELAEFSKVTPEHFCKTFHRYTNMRPFEYVARKRIQEAKRLLETTNLPVSSIGEAVGYPDKSYFGYVFKKYEKISPTTFRGVK